MTKIKKSSLEKGVFWKRGPLRKVHFLEILESLEILENPQTLENKGESDHFLENFEILEILEIPPVKRPFRNDPFFRPRESLGVHKILLSAKVGFTPPRKRAQNEEKLYKSVEDPQN